MTLAAKYLTNGTTHPYLDMKIKKMSEDGFCVSSGSLFIGPKGQKQKTPFKFNLADTAMTAMLASDESIEKDVTFDEEKFFSQIDYQSQCLQVGWSNPSGPEFSGLSERIMSDEHDIPLLAWLINKGFDMGYQLLISSDEENYDEVWDKQIANPEVIEIPESGVLADILASESGVFAIFFRKQIQDHE